MRCVALAAFLPAAIAWGPDGHKITAQVAASQLSSQELSQLQTILGGAGLADVSTWADDVKHTEEYRWTSELHYINVPDNKCNFDWDRDCKDSKGTEGNCVAGAIVNYTQQLGEKGIMATRGCKGLHKKECTVSADCKWDWTGSWTTSCKQHRGPSPSPGPGPSPSPGPGPSPSPGPQGPRDVALKFLVHYMGDIHQPLHVGWTGDRGGNSIKVKEDFDNDKSKNLHAVWDDGIIDKDEENESFQWQGYAKKLAGRVTSDWSSDASKWAACLSASSVDLKACMTEMAEEGIEAACAFAYKDDKDKRIASGDDLDTKYFTTREEVIEKRLAQGGVRLAAVLRYILKQTEETIIV